MREATSLASAADAFAEEVRVNGYTVVPGVLSADELRDVRRKLDAVYEVQVEEVGGEERLDEINDAHVVRLLLAYDEYFLRLATRPAVLSVVERLLGDYFIIGQQNGILIPPGLENYQVSWHRDLAYQHFVCSKPLAVSALFCVDDFNPETGGTHVLPASHKAEPFPSPEFVARHERGVTAAAGSALVFDSMLFHRAGHNRSPHSRRALNHVYTLPFLKQQISIPDALQGRYRDDPFLARFLGYESDPGKNVRQWRGAKIERARALAQA